MPYHQNSPGHGGRRCETERKTKIEIHGYHQKRHQEEWADRSQHSRSQGLEIGSVQGDPLTWKSLQDEKCMMITRTDVQACWAEYKIRNVKVRILCERGWSDYNAANGYHN